MERNNDLTDFELEKIIEFRNRLDDLLTIPSEDLDEGLLSEQAIRFLRFKKYDVEAASSILMQSFRLGLVDEIAKIPYEVYKKVYDARIFVILKKRASDGSKIMWVRPRNWNTDEIDLITYLSAIYHYVDEALYSAKNQKYGFSVVVEGSGLGFVKSAKLLSQFTPDIITQIGTIVQGAYPIKLKAVHHINSSLVLTTFYGGIKYLLSKKIRKRYHIHYKGAEVLLKYFNKNALPVDLNGCIPDEEAIDAKLLKAVNKKGTSSCNTLTLKKYFMVPN